MLIFHKKVNKLEKKQQGNMNGKRIKELLKLKGMNQNELAVKIGIHPQSVSRWINSSYLSTEVVEKVCQALDLEIIDFFLKDPKQLENYTPSWIKPEQLELIKKLNSLPEEKQVELVKAFLAVVEVAGG